MEDTSDGSWTRADPEHQDDEDDESTDKALDGSVNEAPQRKVRYAPGPPELIPSLVLPSDETRGTTQTKESHTSHGRTKRPDEAHESQPTRDRCGEKAERKREIGSILEHLVVHGNYYRHLQWRLQQWKMDRTDDTMIPQLQSTTTESISPVQGGHGVDQDNVGTGPVHKKQKIGPDHERAPPLNISSDVHASDARLYHKQGQEPSVWPKAPMMAREIPMPDASWKEECSDQFVNPIAFSQMRLSPMASLSLLSLPDQSVDALENASDENEDLLYHSIERQRHTSSEDALHTHTDVQPEVAKSTAARVMLLQCWDRAMHAASTTVAVATATHHVEDNDEQLIPPSEMEHTEPSDGDDMPSQPNKNTSECNAATVAEWAKQHSNSIHVLQRILETEVEAQMHQLVEVVLTDAESVLNAKRESQPDAAAKLNAFDVLYVFEKRLSSSRAVRATGTHAIEPCQETLEVLSNEPPLLINAAVLEAMRMRVVDRYAKIPR